MLAISGITNRTYAGGRAHLQAVVVKNGSVTLTKGTDYTLTHKNNINAGTATVVITGIGNYTGTATRTFTINKAANSITASNFVKTYSTAAQSFALGAKAKGGTLTYSSNNSSITVTKAGTVTIKARYIGKATITITAQGTNYSKVTKAVTVTVNPTKTYISSLTSPSAGQMLVKWTKNAVGTGYQIQYATNSTFTTGLKNSWATANTVVSRRITGLTKGKKYYVRMRTYKTVGSVKYYSAWSTIKTVTIK